MKTTSFFERPKPLEKKQQVDWIILNVERFPRYKPPQEGAPLEKTIRRLALEQEMYHPFVCSTLEDFIHWGIFDHQATPQKKSDKRIPLAFVMCTKEEVQRQDPSFFVSFYTYLSLRPSQLIAYWHQLPPERQNLATFAYGDSAVHVYADLDWDVTEYGPLPFGFESETDLQLIQLAFLHLFALAFRTSFGREPIGLDSDQSLHFESATTKTKLSLHVHLLSEAFAQRSHYEQWTKKVFLPLIESEACRNNNPDAQRLGAIVSKPGAKEFGRWKCLLDSSVTHMNHLLRLGANRKPGGKPLVWIPLPPGLSLLPVCRLSLTDDELLFRGLVNYAITSPKERWLSFNTPQQQQPKRLVAASQGIPAELNKESKMEEFQKQPKMDNNWTWMKELPIPWYTERQLPQPRAVFLGQTKAGLPFVRYQQKETICPMCSEKQGQLVRHQSNHCYLTVNARSGRCTFGSTDPDCCKRSMQFDLPDRIRSQLPDFEIQAVHAELDTHMLLMEDSSSPATAVADGNRLLQLTRQLAVHNPSFFERPDDKAEEEEEAPKQQQQQAGFASALDQCAQWAAALRLKRKRETIDDEHRQDNNKRRRKTAGPPTV